MSAENLSPDKRQIKELVEAHLEAAEPEYRWCFAVDMQRVPGKIINKYCFPDALVLHLLCPRCGGEFTFYSEGWKEDYLKNVIFKLHPELGHEIDNKSLNEINRRLFPEYLNV